MATISLLPPSASSSSSVPSCLPTEQYKELYDADIIIGSLGTTQEMFMEDAPSEETTEVFLTVPTEGQETAGVASVQSQVSGNDI